MIAKKLDAPYLPGERKAMVKVKRLRTIDAVVVGWRPGKEEGTVGSLILGLYDEKGELHVVGHTSGLKAKEKRELVESWPRTRPASGARPTRAAGPPTATSSGSRCGPSSVIEVSFDHVSGRAHPPRLEDPALARRQAAAASAASTSSTPER